MMVLYMCGFSKPPNQQTTNVRSLSYLTKLYDSTFHANNVTESLVCQFIQILSQGLIFQVNCQKVTFGISVNSLPEKKGLNISCQLCFRK